MSDEGPHAELEAQPAMEFIDDVEVTTIRRRRVEVRLAPGERWTLQRLSEFVSFAYYAGVAGTDCVHVGEGYAMVPRHALDSTDRVVLPPPPR
ncbi:MAG: hypothetical protein J0I40_00885 [Cellulomonas sp.]|nr:hypothetical protein [Cellulomonas sp.]